MADYKDLYFEMVRACERAINLLIAAQRECEERCISSPEPRLSALFEEEQKSAKEE